MKLKDIVARKDEVLGSLTPHLTGNMSTPLQDRSLTLVDPANITEKIINMDLGKQDYLTQWSNLKFTGPNTLAVKDKDDKPLGQFVVTETAFEQMCMKLGIPSAYLKKCPVTGPAGRQEQLEYWRDQIDDREVMLRTRAYQNTNEKDTLGVGSIRALLPKSYEPIDNFRLWNWTEKLMARTKDLGIIYSSIGDQSTHFRLIWTDPINVGTEQHPDWHYFGLSISDSEVGKKALTVDTLLFRLACLNGMMVQADGDHVLSQRHIHVDFPSLEREFIMSTDTVLQFRDTVLQIIDRTKSESLVDPHSHIRRLVRHYRGTKDFTEAVIKAYEAEPNPTKFGIVQAFTRAARSMPIDRRQVVETMAGEYLMNAA